MSHGQLKAAREETVPESANALACLVPILFFLSGATGLAYQVIWFRRFSHVWGNASLAIGAVLASFLFGLGLGARLIGRRADRLQAPLLWYGILEILIAAFAVLIPFEITALSQQLTVVTSLSPDSAVVGALVRSAATFLVLGPPCLLMGGTLPLLVRQTTPVGSTVSASTGLLYGINTLGASAGCLIAGFFALPTLGLKWTNWTCAALNLCIGLVAIAVYSRFKLNPVLPRQTPARHPATSGLMESPDKTGVGVLHVHLAAFLAGCGALILELVWTRQLALILGGSTYAFTAMLFVVLVGIGLGSLIYHAWIKPRALHAWTAGSVIVVLAVTTALGKAAIPHITLVVASVRDLRSSQVFNAVTCITASAILELLPAICMGVLFPLMVELTRRAAAEAGRTVGGLYASNTAGTILGALGTSLFLIPVYGTAWSMTLAVAVYYMILILLFPSRRRRDGLVCIAFCAIGVPALVVTAGHLDPRLTNVGMYMYGPTLNDAEILYFREGASCNVLVTDSNGDRALRVNGKVDASNSGDMGMQLGLAYFPRFLRPDAQHVLVIGFGSGTTAGASLLFPGTKVTCCEIEPAVVAAGVHFSDVNHRPNDSPEFSVVYDDGRAHLQGTTNRYDLILSEPSNPWMAGVSNLFTREFYRAANRRLTEGGILAQWIQTYSVTPENYAMIVRTIGSVFPHLGLIRISGGDTIVLASQTPVDGTSDAIQAAIQAIDGSSEIRADLDRYFKTTDVRELLLRHFLLSERELRRLGAGGGATTVNTDYNLRLEWDAPLRLFNRNQAGGSVDEVILRTVEPASIEQAFERWGCSGEQALVLHDVAELLMAADRNDVAFGIVQIGDAYAPDIPELLADQLILAPPGQLTDAADRVDRLIELSPDQAARVGVTWWRDKRLEDAVNVFEGVVEKCPNSATAWTNLAIVQGDAGNPSKADEAFAQALAIDSLSSFVNQSYENYKSRRSVTEGE